MKRLAAIAALLLWAGIALGQTTTNPSTTGRPATYNAASVAITGGTISGISSLTGTTALFSPITASLSGTVSLNNTSNYFDGPSIAQGTSGTWWVSGSVVVLDTTGVANFMVKLWDGSTVIASASGNSQGVSAPLTFHLSGWITSPAGNLRISARDLSTTTGSIQYTYTALGKDSTISAFRFQ